MKDKLGADTLYFSCFNPNGRYRLNLSNPAEREIAKDLIVINRRVEAKIKAKE